MAEEEFADEEFADDEFDDDDDAIGARCPDCNEIFGHEVLRERPTGTGSDFLVRCMECSKVHTLQLRPPKPVIISFMLSEGSETFIANIEMDADEFLVLGDQFEHSDATWEINRLEDDEGNSRKRILAERCLRANAMRSDMIRVRLTMTTGEYSESSHVVVERDTIFHGGKLFDHEGIEWRIRAIHTGSGRTLYGRVVAQDIKRVYLHEKPQPQEYQEPRSERDRRQAWKEGRLGYNPNPIRPETIKKDRKNTGHTPGDTRRLKKKRD
jgi:uncharacterized Zn finger protein